MRRLNGFRVAAFCVLTWGFLAIKTSSAQEPPPTEEHFSADDLFGHGRCEASFTSGILFSPFLATHNRPVINYTMTEVQFGYMPTGFKDSGFFRGNLEVAGDAFGSAIVNGPGSYISGVTIWGRYNFVRPRSRFIPYVQAGLGLTSTDIDRHIVGQPFNFNLNLGVGCRYFVAPKWSLNVEYRYQHISNANTAQNNIGINSNGPILGLSYLF